MKLVLAEHFTTDFPMLVDCRVFMGGYKNDTLQKLIREEMVIWTNLLDRNIYRVRQLTENLIHISLV